MTQSPYLKPGVDDAQIEAAFGDGEPDTGLAADVEEAKQVCDALMDSLETLRFNPPPGLNDAAYWSIRERLEAALDDEAVAGDIERMRSQGLINRPGRS